MLINQETSDALIEIYGAFFDLNATLDNAASILLNTWAMPQANNILHNRLAHLTPILADKISEIQDNYNIVSSRPAVHEDKRTYVDLFDMFGTILKEFSEVYNMINMADDIALSHNDKNVHADLMNFVTIFNKVIGQIILLNDKAKQMPTDFDTFDNRIKDWGINGIPELMNGGSED